MIYKRLVVEKVKVKDLFEKLGVEDIENAIISLPFPLGVNTPYGFKNIVTAFRTEKQQTVTSYFTNNATLKTSAEHLLRVNGEWKKVKDITDTDVVETETGSTSIKEKAYGKEEILYDISVADVHCYYSNGVLSHNSWVLSRLGTEALKQGKNVMHFTLELNENYVGLRYDACLTTIPFQEVKNNIDKVKTKLAELPGKLFIKYNPIKTVSPNSLKMHVERVQMLTGVKIDLIIVDYADLLRPNFAERGSNTYNDAGNIYEELRTIAGELQVPVWTASQANRAATNEDVVQAHNVADSYRKIMTGDIIFTASRRAQDKIKGLARFHLLKNRFGQDGITFPSKFDSSNGVIDMYLPDSETGIQLLKIMESQDNSVKDMVKSRWDQMKENNENA